MAARVVGPCVLRAKGFFLSSPILSFYLLVNPILINTGRQPHICQKKCACRACRMPTQQKYKTVNTNNLCAVKHENEKPTFRAPLNLFSVWVFNPVTWKIGWGEKKKRKQQAFVEKNDEMPSLEKTGRQDELKQLYCSLRKKKGKSYSKSK